MTGYGIDESVAAAINSIDETLHWTNKPDLSELVGRTVRIRFSILSGELYAFWFAG